MNNLCRLKGAILLDSQSVDKQQQLQLKQLICAEDALVTRLNYLRQIHNQAYLSAGVFRNFVWSVLHDQIYDFEHTEIDVIFYDPHDIQHFAKQRLIQQLQQKFPNNQWDVVNQACVHQWYKTQGGQSISQYLSLSDAISAWPETATAIAVRLLENDDLEVIAPLGLKDLFELKLRWNNRLVSHDVFMQRVQSKQFLQRWPKLEILD